MGSTPRGWMLIKKKKKERKNIHPYSPFLLGENPRSFYVGKLRFTQPKTSLKFGGQGPLLIPRQTPLHSSAFENLHSSTQKLGANPRSAATSLLCIP